MTVTAPMTAKADKQTTITDTPVEPLCGATGNGAKCVSSVSATKFLDVVNKEIERSHGLSSDDSYVPPPKFS
jgi:hypothetical protein